MTLLFVSFFFFFFQAEDGIRDHCVTGVQTCALPISVKIVMGGNIADEREIFGTPEAFVKQNLVLDDPRILKLIRGITLRARQWRIKGNLIDNTRGYCTDAGDRKSVV